MSNETVVKVAINILGKTYQVKCPETELAALQYSTQYLENQMRHVRDLGNVFSLDSIVVITALNIAHQLINLERENVQNKQTILQRLQRLQGKIETALDKNIQLELMPAE